MRLEPFENQGNFQEDVGLFEAATHGASLELPSPQLQVIQLALDGSNQDATARRLAEGVAQRLGARVHEQVGSRDAADILADLRSRQAGLLVVPVPFGRDFEILGAASLGSVIDMLLLESPCPILCVRDELSDDQVQQVLERVLLPVAVGEPPAIQALAWGFHLLTPQSELELLAIADVELLTEARQLVDQQVGEDAFDAEHVTRAILRETGGLVAAAQRQSSLQNTPVHVTTRTGRFVPQVLEQVGDSPQLVIREMKQDHGAPSFHRSVDLLLASRGPVLLTPAAAE